MKITVTGKNLSVTPALKETAEKKLKKLDRYFREDTPVNVVLSVDGYRQTCEVTIPFARVTLRGEAMTQDMYASIDEVLEILEGQIRRHRTRLSKRLRPEQPEIVAWPEEEEEPAAPKIVRTKRFAIKPMMTEEAVLQMQLLGHDFFVYLNAQTDEVNVVYLRKDGNYGLIEPTFDEDDE
ncbi:MAG: ribosome-associated translation inhibitor RaiA [Eubacteriales bacterium]|nr:ribosome-associated translation inhibitor RaiA [Eubacteriales bacterium]